MGSASSFSKSNANANASSVPNSYANSGIYDSNQGPEWQWRTDDLQWRSYSRACSAAIEAARVSGRSSVEINVGEGSNPTHFVFFQNQGLRQVNHRTHRGRPVRRYISGQSSTATWEWLETKRGQWHEYSDRLTSKFEAAWMGCTTSRTHNKKDCPAGLFFRLNGQAYSILFEADGIQCNLKTSSCRSIRRCTYLLNQMSSSYDQNLNLDTNSANYNSSLEAEWQWRTNDLHWRSYSHACSASIEAAFADGRPSVEINVFQDSSPTHLVYFENQTLVQVNRRTHRVRPVRRNIIGQSLAAIWEWWEAERSQWYEYGDHLSSKFEAAWIDCTASRTSGKQDCLAGVFFELNGRKYSILFEAVGMQYNVRTSSSRSVRRCTYLSSQTSTPQPEDMSHCQASNVTVQGQVTRNESEELNGSDYKYSDFICCANTDDEECSICLCSFQEDKAVELSKCHHLFHRQCIEQWFKTRPTCPQCLTVYDVITGNRPPGDMSIRCISSRSKEAENGIQGYPGIDIIEITYRFSSGIQTAEHPKPGRPYAGAVYVAYLPKNKDGEEVLELLEIAWIRRLLFTVGAAGMIDMVVWASIQNKTQKNGGASNNGYPDETYFNRVRSELARVNIM